MVCEREKIKVVVLLTGLNKLTSAVLADITNGQAGTDSTLFSKSQTGLQTAVGATNIALIDTTSTTSQVSATHQLNTSTGNGSTYVEFEVNNGTYSYNRSVKAGKAKTNTVELTIAHTFDFELVI